MKIIFGLCQPYKSVFIFTAIIFSCYSFGFVPWFVTQSNIYMGKTMPGPGTCELDLDTQALTGSLCASSTGSIGQYQLHANPNTNVQIVVQSINDSGDGITFASEGRFITDLDPDISFLGGISQTIDSGPSGVIQIQVAGRLTISGSIALDTVYTPQFDITYTEL